MTDQWYGVQTNKGWFVLETDHTPIQFRIRASRSHGGMVFIFDERGEPIQINNVRRGHDVRIYQIEDTGGVSSVKDLVDRGKSLGEVVDGKPIKFENYPERL